MIEAEGNVAGYGQRGMDDRTQQQEAPVGVAQLRWRRQRVNKRQRCSRGWGDRRQWCVPNVCAPVWHSPISRRHGNAESVERAPCVLASVCTGDAVVESIHDHTRKGLNRRAGPPTFRATMVNNAVLALIASVDLKRRLICRGASGGTTHLVEHRLGDALNTKCSPSFQRRPTSVIVHES